MFSLTSSSIASYYLSDELDTAGITDSTAQLQAVSLAQRLTPSLEPH